jgi:hypothetical protein
MPDSKGARWDVLYYNYRALKRDENGRLRIDFRSDNYTRNFLYGVALQHYRKISKEALSTIQRKLNERFMEDYRRQP